MQNELPAPVSQEQIDLLRELLQSLTPGPWKSYIEGRDHFGGDSFVQTGGEDIYISGNTDSDQDFIALARNVMPALLAEIEKSRNESAQLQEKA